MFSLLLSDEGINLLKSIIREAVQEIMEETTSVDSPKENSSSWVNTNEDKFLTRKEVSLMLNVSKQTLNNWQKKQILIPLKIGNRVLYKLEDVEKALQKQESNSKNHTI